MAIGRRAVVVEWKGRNPCDGEGLRASVREGRKRRSRTLAAGHKREIGLYDVPWSEGLPGFGIGITSAVFQIAGMTASLTERLNKLVRNSIPLSPRCLRWREVKPSGPIAVKLLACLMASRVCSVVNGT